MRKVRPTNVLARKLRAIRLRKGLSQTEMFAVAFPEAEVNNRAMVSQWEKGIREPFRQVLIRYARFAGVTLDELFDDSIPLPAHFHCDAQIKEDLSER